jgi:hypothetical protein
MAGTDTKNGNQGDGGGPKVVVLDQSQMDQVEGLSRVLTKAQMANYFGICENTFRKIEERQPEVNEAYMRGRAGAIAGVGENLVSKALNGDTRAMEFYLKTQAGWTDQTRVELTGASGRPVETVTLTKEEYMKSRQDMLDDDDC